jgi:hypothetical protein
MFNGNGNWNPQFSAKSDRDNGIKILADRFDDILIEDIKQSFQMCATVDSETKLIASWDFNSNKGINLALGTNPNDAVSLGQMNNAISEGITSIYNFGTISGLTSLEPDKIYRGIIGSDNVIFALTTPANIDTFHQIKLMLSINGTGTISFQMDGQPYDNPYWFDKEVVEFQQSNYYDLYMDYSPDIGAWIFGAMIKELGL